MNMDYLEQNIPEDIYEVDFDVDQMIKSNLAIRDKIKDIAVVVKQAITKAALLKKTVVTHRDPPKDPEVKDKQKQIKQYQDAINTCRSYIHTLNTKIENMNANDRLEVGGSKVKKLNRDIKKLQEHKRKINTKHTNQLQVVNNLYADPEYQQKITSMNDEIRRLKEKYDTQKTEKKKMKEKQKVILDDMANVNKEYRRLQELKISLQNGISPGQIFKKDHDLKEEIEVIKKRTDAFQK